MLYCQSILCFKTVVFDNQKLGATMRIIETGIGLITIAMLLSGCQTAVQGPAQSVASVIAAPMEPAPLAYAAPGTKISYSGISNRGSRDRTIEILEPEDARGQYRNPNGSTGSTYPGCFFCGGTRAIEEDKYVALWPLEVGKEVTFVRTRANGGRSQITITVSGTETVTTPAGTFDTYVLTGKIKNIDGIRWSASLTDWWAPSVGWIVKKRTKESDGDFLKLEVTQIAS